MSDDNDNDQADEEGYEDDDDFPVPTAYDVLEYIAKAIVEDADSVEVELDDTRRNIRLNVHSAKDDMGRLIGRRGRVAGAIRTVVSAAAARDDVRVEVEFVE